MQRASGLLPSRAADNLFWVGRYVERAEATLRLVRAMINRAAEADETAAPVIAGIGALLEAWNAVPSDAGGAPAASSARAALTRARSCRIAALSRRRRAIGRLRDPRPFLAGCLARDQRSRHHDRHAACRSARPESAIIERVEAALRIIASLSGLAQENMTQLAGWRFLELGRRIERAILTGRLVRCFALAGAPEGGLDVLLELADSQITYRQRYVMVAARAPVIDLVMLDPNNPRSVAFQLDRIEAHLAALPGRNAAGRLSPVQQIAASIATRLRTVEAAAIDEALIIDIEQSLMKLSDAITRGLSHQQRALRIRRGRRWRDLRRPADDDVRLCVAGGACAPCAAADADQSRRPARACRRLADRARAAAPARGTGFFRQPADLDRNRRAAQDADGQTGGARHRRPAVEPAPLRDAGLGSGARTRLLRTSDIGPLSPAHFLFPSRMVSLDPEIRDYTRESFPPAGRCSMRRSS